MKREVNVDLFRVIATFLVIVLHILGQGGILSSLSPSAASYWIAWLVEIMAYCAVNCFALISGYVMVQRNIKIKNILGLWLQTAFYSLLISALFFVFVPETRSIKSLVVAFLPIVGNQWWYMSAYFALFFSIPIINAGINHIAKETLEKLLAVILIGICIIDCAIPIDAFAIKDGYSPMWLIMMYLLGTYIKKYDVKQKTTATKSLLLFGLMVVITFLSKLIIFVATNIIMGQVKYDKTFISYISITIVLSAIFLFLFCLKVKIKPIFERIIGALAPTTLGIYLIHVHPFVFQYVIKDAFVNFAHKPAIIMILCVIVAALAVFFICFVIDRIRIQLFNLLRINKLCEFISNKITGICDSLKE